MSDERVEQTGFEIEGRMYPMPQSFRLGDPVLVTHLTGLTWAQFVDGLDDEDRQQDPVILLGLIAVAVWQGNTRWTRERTERYVELLDLGAVVVRGPEPEAEPLPPAVPATPSPVSPETLSASPESDSDPIPASSGTPESGTTSPDSTPA